MASLEDRIRRLEIRAEINEFLSSYCRAADTFDAKRQASLYTDDCVVSYIADASPVHGRTALLGFLQAYFDSAVSGSHHIANVELLFKSDDVVDAHTYMYSWQRFKAFPVTADCHRWGRYEIRLVRTGDGWRISHMNLLSAGEYGGARIGEQFGRPWPPRFE
jgi:ketosteroid isomerase-like protein